MRALLPAALALLFACWSGTLWGGAGFLPAAIGQAALLIALVAGGREAFDPWRLGRAGALLLWAFWLAMAASTFASPVPRAGRVAVLLAPALFLVPAAVARCLESARHREIGIAALALGASGVAGWALVDQLQRRAPEAAQPLGHHVLLAAWLVAVFPLVLLSLGRPGIWRWLGLQSGLLVAAAIVATGSLLGMVAMGVQACLSATTSRRAWRLVLGAGLLALAFAVPRLERVVRGQDPSAAARTSYARAGLAGWQERPLLGWGAGATPWTLSAFLAPAPGVRPTGEVVGDLHSTPLAVLYELGATGALLAIALAVAAARARLRERRQSRERRQLTAALVGLAGLSVVAAGCGALAVTALPVVAGVVYGFALAAMPRPAATAPASPSRLALAWAIVAALALVPIGRAWREYELAIASPVAAAREHLARAADLDPGFPLYAARLAMLDAPADEPPALTARLAAESSWGAAPLWLEAGVLASRERAPWARRALVRACELDPGNPIVLFALAEADPMAENAPRLAARALLGEPRLAAALFWEQQGDLWGRTLVEVEREAGVNAGWRATFLKKAQALSRGSGALAEIGLTLDSKPATAPTLYLFRRRPWRGQIGAIPLRAAGLGQLSITPATNLASTSAAIFSRAECR